MSVDLDHLHFWSKRWFQNSTVHFTVFWYTPILIKLCITRRESELATGVQMYKWGPFSSQEKLSDAAIARLSHNPGVLGTDSGIKQGEKSLHEIFASLLFEGLLLISEECFCGHQTSTFTLSKKRGELLRLDIQCLPEKLVFFQYTLQNYL